MPLDDGLVLPSQADAVESQDSVDLDDYAGAETELEQAPQTESQNWDDDSNPYKNRFKGLQSTVQREVETRRELEQRLQMMEMAMLQSNTAHMEPEQRAYALRDYTREQQLRRREMEINDAYLRNETISKANVMTLLAQKYGVPKGDLEDFDTPEAMEKFAQKVSQSRRTSAKQQRQAGGNDSFEGSGTGSAPRGKPKSYDEAGDRLIAQARRMGLV